MRAIAAGAGLGLAGRSGRSSRKALVDWISR